MRVALTLKLLGAPALSVGEQPLPALAAIDVALLAVLALQGAQPRQQVSALLWPDADTAGAATNLRQRIYRLKRLAGRVVVEGERSINLPGDLQHDLQGYAEQLATDPGHGRGALLGTLEFPGHDTLSAWLAVQREALAQTRVRVLAKAAQAHAAQGRLQAALVCAQRYMNGGSAACCCRWPLASRLTLTGTNQSLDPVSNRALRLNPPACRLPMCALCCYSVPDVSAANGPESRSKARSPRLSALPAISTLLSLLYCRRSASPARASQHSAVSGPRGADAPRLADATAALRA